ncbi:Spermidine/putrescine import ATP-binding protein PotA [Nymphon striatum]|nr:Spermidine/putrescine import ATP-binding protein PotA [Nymphon striatum]
MNGREIAGPNVFLPPEKRSVGLMFQDFALFPHMTILDNVRFGLTSMSKAMSKQEALGAIRRVGLEHHKNSYPDVLSGGEQQRVALARALAPRPAVMLMDEPFSGLDTRLKDSIRSETLAILRETRATTIVVTHDAEEAMRMGDRIALLDKGMIVQTGTAQEIYHAPKNLFVSGNLPAVRVAIRTGGIDIKSINQPVEGVLGRIKGRRFLGDFEQLSLAVEGAVGDVQARIRAGELAFDARDVVIKVRNSDIMLFESEEIEFMGITGWWQWVIVLVIVLLLFGRGKIPELMGDVAKGIKSFKKGMADEVDSAKDAASDAASDAAKTVEHVADDAPRVVRGFSKSLGTIRKTAGEFRKQFDDALSEAELDDLKTLASDVKDLDPRNKIKDALNPLGEIGKDINDELKGVANSIENDGAPPQEEYPQVGDALKRVQADMKAKEAAAKKTAVKKTTAKKSVAKKPVAKKPATKSATSKTATRAAPVKKTAAKNSSAVKKPTTTTKASTVKKTVEKRTKTSAAKKTTCTQTCCS